RVGVPCVARSGAGAPFRLHKGPSQAPVCSRVVAEGDRTRIDTAVGVWTGPCEPATLKTKKRGRHLIGGAPRLRRQCCSCAGSGGRKVSNSPSAALPRRALHLQR